MPLKLFSLVLGFLCTAEWSAAYERNVVRTLTVSNGGQWGDWFTAHFCPLGSYAAGFELKVEPPQLIGDDTAGNGVGLYCKTKENKDVWFISWYAGPWGKWKGRSDCERSNFITGFKLKVEGSQGNGDDTAMNGMKVHCRKFGSGGRGYELLNFGGALGRGIWGDWDDWSDECPVNSAVCGLEVRFEKSQGDGDDTALNDVKLHCCDD